MEQLLLHLVGDYVTQTHKMAMLKTSRFSVAAKHATIYSIPFLLIGSTWAFIVILVTHALIDHFAIVKRMRGDAPLWVGIVADNTVHLLINYSALRWLS